MKPLDAPQRALSFGNNPPLSLPLRYFLSAPLFAALAAAFLAWQGEAALLTRWSPLTLAITHLMVLGCLSMTMIGALLQMLPVVAGIEVPRTHAVGAVVHVCLCAGTLALAAGFWLGGPVLFRLAMALLLAGLMLFVGACTVAMWQYHLPGAGAVVAGIRLSLAALVLTMILGGMLASGFAWPGMLQMPLQRITDLHAMWGMLGWVGLLVIGIAFQVMPMFMLTEPYPKFLTGAYSTWMFILLGAASLSRGWTGHGTLLHLGFLALLAAGYALFGGATLYLLARRKRPHADPTTLFWRTAMVCLLAALGVWLWPAAAPSNAAPLAVGVLLIAGFALSAVSGMLYKIVPFLTWYHLQDARARSGRKPPNINQIIPERHAQWQYGVHLAGLLLLLAACYQPALARPGAVLMCAACLGLWFNLGRAVTHHILLVPAQS
ncbi:permease [Duganella sp. FT94W]|uniref:Permease n=1 Tax=Duganella lactea TaxID=2692173 RepID=A0ABW9V3Y9_9BURK|nr:permease [Duganella lactea]MYM33435.1 permease [Duganella lactea]